MVISVLKWMSSNGPIISRTKNIPILGENAEPWPWFYMPAVEEVFDAHPKNLKESFGEIFPLGTCQYSFDGRVWEERANALLCESSK